MTDTADVARTTHVREKYASHADPVPEMRYEAHAPASVPGNEGPSGHGRVTLTLSALFAA
jgi:hypothetical protein